MFKFGFIKEAIKDFDQLTRHPHGMKDPWVFYNLATCLIQIGYPEKPLYQIEKEKLEKEKQKDNRKSIKNIRKSMLMMNRPSLLLANDFMNNVNLYSEAPLVNVSKNQAGIENYNYAIEMCDKAYELGGHDKEIMLDALKLKGMCLFRLGELIKSVKVLYKARMLQRKINEEIEARRRAREKHEVEEIDGYFTIRDLRRIA